MAAAAKSPPRRLNAATLQAHSVLSDPSQGAGFAAATGPFLLGRVCRATGWIALFLLAACAPAPVSRSALPPAGPLLQFAVSPAHPPSRPNGQVAQDFLDLEFHLESGQTLPALSRFDGPITVALTGQIPPTAAAETARLVARLQAEAGLDLHITDAPANITIQFAPASALQRLDRSSACFVAPNVSSLSEYRAGFGSDALEWQNIRQRQRLAIFIPTDTSPQEQRDCLHEELAQALGPLNDLYRLPDSVFNDDNFLSTLTGFDMLMLRLHYAPELANGMTEPQVAARLPALLHRLNPSGEVPGQWDHPGTPRDWIQAVQTALGPDSPQSARRPAAERMLSIAQTEGWQDARLGLAYFALGRLEDPNNPYAAEQDFLAAASIFARLPDGGARLAHALLQLAAINLALNDPEQVIRLTNQALPLAETAQNAALIANLMRLQAEALTLTGQPENAAALRLDSLPAARYGFGSAATAMAGP
ncbi:MAG: DUF2927 domain-containing protein [Pseudorhodobacter sp.]|nr:DUF2927 domain-containing protein [Pseudorhodobacter sp.]